VQGSQRENGSYPYHHRSRQATSPKGDDHDNERGQHFDGPAHKDGRGDERDEDGTRYLIEPRPARSERSNRLASQSPPARVA
jgi:hypothetical protein